MTIADHEHIAWERFTVARVAVLDDIQRGMTAQEIAGDLSLSYSGVRSHVRDLKELTGCHSMRELATWWREHRNLWATAVETPRGSAANRDVS
jgi:DNA-binding NarL/FixJ family response regulator